MTRKIVATALFLALGACSSIQSGGGPADLQTLSKGAYAARASYAVYLAGGNAYASLPRCERPSPPPCSKQGVVETLRSVDKTADSATLTYEVAVRAMPADLTNVQAIASMANASIEVYRKILDQYQGGK